MRRTIAESRPWGRPSRSHALAHYIRVGRYDKAVERNAHAVATDRHYLEGRHLSGIYPIGYYPHNIHFLWAALMMQGRSADALQAARELDGAVSVDTVRHVPEIEFLIPPSLLGLVRFGQWKMILAEPAPSPDLTYSTALWHYARGLAFVATGQLNQAQEERRQLAALSAAMPPERIIGLNTARVLLQIAARVLDGQIAAKHGHSDEAPEHFSQAVHLQDGLRYYEPLDWYYPVRESLGTLLLNVGRPGDAERVFREDLTRTPENPWSLHGLARGLRAQARNSEAATAEERFRRAWAHGDLEFQPSRFEAFLVGADAR